MPKIGGNAEPAFSDIRADTCALPRAARMECAEAGPFLDPSLSPDDIESRALTWLMGGFLAKGVVTGLVGLPGAGKSILTTLI